MITRIDAKKRYRQTYEWLETYHLFSFGNYFDPMNLEFGVLRVFNDDRINAYSGFDEHGHDNMEIVTILLEGQLTHRDSMGNVNTISAGEIQRMSAGTGVIHAEKNLGDEPVHLYQLWFFPQAHNRAPSYAQTDVSYLEKNVLTPVVSNVSREGVLQMSADATIYLGEFETNHSLSYTLSVGRGVFVYLQTGSCTINGVVFQAGDQARILHEAELTLQVQQDTKFVWIDVGGV